jgi:hypothetical protein
MHLPFRKIKACVGFLLGSAAALRADEGMWLFSAPPRRQIAARYGFELTDPWLQHLMHASVRFNSGGSGSFVSALGLVITNHHVGLDALQKMSAAGKNYVRDGFYAATAAEEVKCLDLELNVLQSIEDVTARINAAVPAGASPEAANRARQAAITTVEGESRRQTGLRSDVVTLFQGGAYHLYRSKRYTDVRLVFAPEQQAAFYGGDPDNFEYPRYDLDICLFRVYENGRPLQPADYLHWSKAGAADHELVFVSGHPGHTDRLLTTPELESLRDLQFPLALSDLYRREVLLTAWSSRSAENARRAKEDLFGVRNSRKVRQGMLAGLQDPAFLAAKRAAEAAFRARLPAEKTAAGVEISDSIGSNGPIAVAYRRIAIAQANLDRVYARYRLLESATAFNSDEFRFARSLLRDTAERTKPAAARLNEYSEARRESRELALFSEKPIYSDLEILTLTDSLSALVSQLGGNDPTVQTVLAGRSPSARAADLVARTQLGSVAFRRKLYAGEAAVAAAADPMIELARSIDEEARGLRKTVEAQQEVQKQAHALIERARFEALGDTVYPDATFTLRLSYGTVSGYQEESATAARAGGPAIPFHTTLGGMYQRSAEHENQPPFDLPERWRQRRAATDLSAPLDFVSDCDIIGGNSGSPTVNRAGDFIGIVFDGNLESLPGDLYYPTGNYRGLSVDSAGILTALRQIYQAPALADELSR